MTERTPIHLMEVGVRNRSVEFEFHNRSISISAGCFTGTVADFRKSISLTYQQYDFGKKRCGPSVRLNLCDFDVNKLARYRAEYMAVADFAEALEKIWCRKTLPRKAKTKSKTKKKNK